MKIFLFTLILISFTNIAYSENTQNLLKANLDDIQKKPPPETITNDIINIGRDAKYIVTSPFRLKKSDILPVGAVLALTGGLISLDKDIRDLTSDKNGETSNESTKKFFGHFEPLGNGKYLVPTYLFMYSAGKLFDKKDIKNTGLMAFESFIISGAITLTLKYTFSRKRPAASNNSLDFNGPVFKFGEQSDSFPSGHTTSAFALASVVSAHYDSTFISVFSYSLATLVGAQRITNGVHWASDVLTGAIIGTLVGHTVVKLHKKRKNDDISFIPELSPKKRYAGLKLRIKF